MKPYPGQDSILSYKFCGVKYMSYIPNTDHDRQEMLGDWC